MSRDGKLRRIAKALWKQREWNIKDWDTFKEVKPDIAAIYIRSAEVAIEAYEKEEPE